MKKEILKLKLRFIIILIIAYATLSVCMGQSQSVNPSSYQVKGRVVDAKGRSVSDAVIGWDSVEETGCTIELATSAKSGYFSIQIPQSLYQKIIRIFVSAPIPTNAIILPMLPFTTEPEWFTLKYISRRLTLKGEPLIDIGDIPVKAFFSLVRVRILDNKGEPLLTSVGQWSKVVIRLKDKKGRIVTANTISKKDIKVKVNLKESEIPIAIPSGEWRVEVGLKGYKSQFYSSPISTNQSDRQLSRTLNLKIP